MQHPKGFSLIECLVYCAVMGSLCMLAFSYFSRQNQALSNFIASAERTMACHATISLLSADIARADSSVMHWHKDHHELVWRSSDHAIGWHWRENTIYRSKGDYDFVRHAWINKSTALVARHAVHFELIPKENNGRVIGVHYRLEDGTTSYQRIALLINRAIT